MPLRDLNLEAFYEGYGDEIALQALTPLLRETVSYDRLSSYFSISSFLSIADGLEQIWKRQGSVRLIMGLHDLDKDVLEAARLSESPDAFPMLDSIKERIVKQVSALQDEMLLRRIETFALMLREGFVKLKVASHPLGEGAAIFHNKRFIFRDEAGDIVTGSSGMNETVRGLSRNYDELTLQRSWIDGGGQLEKHIESFERLWSEQVPNLVIQDVDSNFSEELLAAARDAARPAQNDKAGPKVLSLEAAIKSCPTLFFLSLGGLSLFPHQERVVLEATDSFPIRRMFADEVGLGKTIEAGATLKFLSDYGACEKVLLACPQGLMRQWREEMQAHFDEDYWVWDSASKSYESSSGQRISSPDGFPFFPNAPTKKIISSHLLRTQRYRELLEADETIRFDAFVLDESHSARMTIDNNGRIKTTKMWEVAQILGSRSTNCILLTATPMQIHPIELFGQLMILGLAGKWADPSNFVNSIDLMSGAMDSLSLDDCRLLANLITDSASPLRITTLDESSQTFVVQLLKIEDEFEQAIFVSQGLDLAYRAFVLLHPVHQLVIRNTRESLMAMGYTFPNRIHSAPEVFASTELAEFLRRLASYLEESYGALEKVVAQGNRSSTGFTISTYYQRLASSLIAAQQSLVRRKIKLTRISEILESTRPAINLDDLDDYEDEELDGMDEMDDVAASLEKALGDPKKRSALRQAVQSELMYLGDLLSNLGSMEPNLLAHDSKFHVALEILTDEFATAPVLVFSRYTDTLTGFIQFFEERFSAGPNVGYGLYSGGEIWIQVGTERIASSKAGVVRNLNENSIKVLFCSDAASEGLNLQAAGSIINLDVPWNPARLEQRIGRIDRLGQKKSEVRIYNLWYPNSVEAEMYKRLLSRKEALELAVGAFPSLVADSIKQSVAEFFGKSSESAPELISELELLRNRKQAEALGRLWARDNSKATRTRELRRLLREMFLNFPATAEAAESLVLEEGSAESFALFHPDFRDWWAERETYVARAGATCVSAIVIDAVTAGFIVSQEKGYRRLRDTGIVEVISIVGGLAVEVFDTESEIIPVQDPLHLGVQLLSDSGLRGIADIVAIGDPQAKRVELGLCATGRKK